jgi:Ca-activated chloride channel family protein
LVLESVKAKGRVAGRMLDMTIEQRFRNSEAENVEVVYTFPLPWHADLLGLEVELNGETLTGQVKAKAQARSDYEEALSEGNTGILVSVNADRTYTLELGNLLKGESCVIRLHYVQTLQPQQGSLRLTLPTTIAPRYGDAIRDGGYEPHAVPETSATVEYPFEIRLAIHGELVQAQIGSPTHKVAIRSIPAVGSKETFMTEVSLAAQAWLDRDFVLVFDQLPHASLGLAAWDRLDEGLGVVMASFTPKLPAREPLPVAMKILVDCSGSMNGDSIQAARSALQRILDELGEADRFSLSRFGDTVEHRSKAMWKGAPAALAASRRWAEKLQADLGGTEMNQAILSTLALPGTERNDVLLITDGEIQAIDTVVETARKSRHRFFVVGIGASAAEGLLRRLAQETGGSCEFVFPGEQVEPAIVRLYHRMRSPAVTRTRIEWPQGCRIHAASDLPESVFDGDDVTVFARLHADTAELLTQSVRLLGRVAGVEGEICLAELQAEFIADEANTLARLAASQRYWQLKKASEQVPAVLKKQLPELAEKYQLVTDDTSLILVKKREEGLQAKDMPELRTVKNMLAAGWGGQGSVTDPLGMSRSRSSHSHPVVRFSRTHVASGLVVPSVWRTNRSPAADRVDALIAGSLDDFEIPAFLRKQSDDAQFRDVQVWKAPPPTTPFWVLLVGDGEQSEGEGTQNSGLSPAGLAEGLNRSLRTAWPKTYQELEDIQLVPRVIEWLEVVVGEGQPEAEVVQAFLQVMSQMDFTMRQTVTGALKKLIHRGDKQLSALQGELQDSISKALDDVTATTWPAGILNYAEAGQEG